MAVVVPAAPLALIAHADGPLVRDFATRAAYGDAETFGGVAEVTHLAAATPAVANTGKPVSLGGAEITHVGKTSMWATAYKHSSTDVVPIGATPGVGEIELTEERGVVFDPLGHHDDLAPLAARTVSYRATLDGGAETDASVTVLGAAGLATQKGVSVVALDADGDPVAFRFDRPMRIGLTADRTAFVVAEPLTRPAITGVRFLSNDGVPQDIALTNGRSRIVTWRGATLWVLAAPGRIPLGDPTPLTITTAYSSKVAEPTWGAEWSGSAGVHAKLTVRGNFETAHLYLDAGAGEAQVRFRPAAGGRWFPAQPLWFDDPTQPGRNPADFTHGYFGETVAMSEIIPGAHRGVILHLAAGESYDVEVAHGGVVYRQTVATRSYKPAKTSWEIGARTQVISVERSGADVVVSEGWGGSKVTLHTFTAPAGYVELTGLRLRGATLYVNTHGVIVRDGDVLGAPGSNVRFGPLGYDVRLVRGRYRGWGNQDGTSGWGMKARGNGCVLMNQSTIFDGDADIYYSGQNGGAYDVPTDQQHGNHTVAMIGMLIGAPRHPANSWQHIRADSATSTHPYGSTVLYSSRGSFKGLNALLDLSVDAPRFKCVDELISGDNDGIRRGPAGPDLLMGPLFMAGSSDDAVELDGPAPNCAAVGVHFEARHIASEAHSPQSILSAAPIYWGPVIVSRCSAVWLKEPWMYVVPGVPRPFGWPTLRMLKIPRRQDGLTTDNGWIFMWHCTMRGADGTSSKGEAQMWWQYTGGAIFTAVRNCLFRQRDTWTDPSGSDVIWQNNDFLKGGTSLGYIGETPILANPSVVAVAQRAFNINDGGPWAVADADLRCGGAV